MKKHYSEKHIQLIKKEIVNYVKKGDGTVYPAPIIDIVHNIMAKFNINKKMSNVTLSDKTIIITVPSIDSRDMIALWGEFCPVNKTVKF